MNYITVGKIIKAHGIKGEVKILPLTDDPGRFKKLKLVYIDGQPRKILACRLDFSFVYLQIQGSDTRDDASALVGKLVEVDRVNAVTLPDGGYFIADVIGCSVTDETGLVLGVITAVDAYGAADVITARQGGRVFRFPFLNSVVSSVDTDNKRFNVIKARFDGVCVYED